MNHIHSDISYVFKVSFVHGVWRKIQVPSEYSLDILHLAILESYNFEDDHLYAFFMDNILWSGERVCWSPFAESLPSTDTVKLSSFDFKKGDSFLYLFDFEDEWIFDVTFVTKVIGGGQEVVILGGRGKSPEQYTNYEEDFY